MPGFWSTTDREVAAHVGIGARRRVTARQDLGVRIEYDDIGGHALLGVRALDYRYRVARVKGGRYGVP